MSTSFGLYQASSVASESTMTFYDTYGPDKRLRQIHKTERRPTPSKRKRNISEDAPSQRKQKNPESPAPERRGHTRLNIKGQEGIAFHNPSRILGCPIKLHPEASDHHFDIRLKFWTNLPSGCRPPSSLPSGETPTRTYIPFLTEM
jgi:hypothetical protein